MKKVGKVKRAAEAIRNWEAEISGLESNIREYERELEQLDATSLGANDPERADFQEERQRILEEIASLKEEIEELEKLIDGAEGYLEDRAQEMMNNNEYY